MFVERKRWMTAEEFNDVYALCQFLPGPNVVNLTAVFGSRMRGPTGAIAAWSGFLIVPFCVMLAAGMLYERYGDVEIVRRVLSGVAPAAAGLLIATVAKMAAPMFRSFGPAPVVRAGDGVCDRPDALAAACGAGSCWCRSASGSPGACGRGAAMKADGDILITLAVQFAMMSLLALGGANAVVPEMHRQAVELRGWMSDHEFTDMFAMSQAAPGPNVMLVTLIGYHVAGFGRRDRHNPGDVRADSCAGPFSGQDLGSLQGRALASGGADGRCADFRRTCRRQCDRFDAVRPIIAGSRWSLPLSTAAIAFWMRWNPLWLIGIAGLAGLTGLV